MYSWLLKNHNSCGLEANVKISRSGGGFLTVCTDPPHWQIQVVGIKNLDQARNDLIPENKKS